MVTPTHQKTSEDQTKQLKTHRSGDPNDLNVTRGIEKKGKLKGFMSIYSDFIVVVTLFDDLGTPKHQETKKV